MSSIKSSLFLDLLELLCPGWLLAVECCEVKKKIFKNNSAIMVLEEKGITVMITLAMISGQTRRKLVAELKAEWVSFNFSTLVRAAGSYCFIRNP